MPAYNAEQWVSDSIQSVLQQTHRQLELIVVDDGSVDNTVNVVERTLSGSQIRHRIVRQENAGAAKARNRGWSIAEGDWIQFLDADDSLEPEKIELQISAAARMHADVFYSDWCRLGLADGVWKQKDIRTPFIHQDAIADLLSDRNFLQLGCMLVRTNLLASTGGFDTTHEPTEDIGLCIKIAMGGAKFVKADCSRPVAFYRDLPRSFSKIDYRKFIEACIKNAKLADQYIAGDEATHTRTAQAIVDVYLAGSRFYAGVDWSRFEELLADIERLQPGFIPRSPRHLKLLSRAVGYRTAERVAVWYREGRKKSSSLRPF
jgi:glycosyltransferase involved in cell wall biosynthesis